MTEVTNITEMAKGISDYGVLIIIGAIYLLLSASMMIAVFKWFKSIINKIVEQQDLMNDLHNDLATIAEGMRSETQLRIRNLSGFAFDLSTEQVCQMIRRIRRENHIADKGKTDAKVHSLLHNIHEDRKSRFDAFTYKGQPLSAYCNDDWVDKVSEVVEAELYNANGIDDGRAYTNVKMVYDEIKLDFYHRLSK